jgi:hypothetical protein
VSCSEGLEILLKVQDSVIVFRSGIELPGTAPGGFVSGCRASRFFYSRTQAAATGFRFSKFLACSNANAICSTPQSS